MSGGTITRWSAVLELLRERLPAKSFSTWFQHAEVLDSSDGRLVLGVPNLFIKNWIEKNYAALLRELVREHHGCECEVEVRVSAAKFQAMRKAQQRELAREQLVIATSAGGGGNRTLARVNRDGPQVNPGFQLEALVAGPGNQMAKAACERVVEHPGEYNPLFIYGGSGLGKTHLLHGVCNRLREQYPERLVTCICAEEFLSRFTQAIASRRLEAFRRRIRGCDYLFIDDVQLLGTGNKAGTQAEIVQTIDALLHRGKQIIFTADQPPARIQGLDRKLAGRLEAGLVAAIEAPDFQTRCQILHTKAARRHLILPAKAVEWVADNHHGSVRLLEGAISRLEALSRLEGRKITAATAASVLGPLVPARGQGLKQVARVVAREFGVTADELCSRKRSRHINLARLTAIWIARRLTGCSLAELGTFFGNRTASAILQALRRPPAEHELQGTLAQRTQRALADLGSDLDAHTLFHPQAGLFPEPTQDQAPGQKTT